MNKKNISIALGPILFLLLEILLPNSIPKPAQAMIASIVWIAFWWVTEAVPIAVTSLLPLVLFPLTEIMDLRTTTVPYSNPLIYLFVGGFVLALAMEKWNLHKRIALNIIKLVGVKKRQLILGFIIATGFLSMWISNTATTVMMLPIALSIIKQSKTINKGDSEIESADDSRFAKALILSLPYAASIGGMATLVGTPTNLIFADAVKRFYDIDIPFDQWMYIGFPIAILLLFVCWLHLTRGIFKISNKDTLGEKNIIQTEIDKLGKIQPEEKWVLVVFCTVAFAWITRRFLITPFFPAVNDTIIVLIGALLLFVIPSTSKKEERLMDWKTAIKLPWGVLLLFGGAFAVAAGFQESGLTVLIGKQLGGLNGISFFIVLFVIILVVNFMTEVTLNMAMCTLMMPILATLAIALDVHPYGLMVGTCIAASCAFMLPIATAPNAVVFGSGAIKIKDMIRAGFLLNVISVIVIAISIYLLLPIFWNIDLQSFPSVFKK